MAKKQCLNCGRFHAGSMCENGHRQNPAVDYPTMPSHGHTIHGQQPRVPDQVSRVLRPPKAPR